MSDNRISVSGVTAVGNEQLLMAMPFIERALTLRRAIEEEIALLKTPDPDEVDWLTVMGTAAMVMLPVWLSERRLNPKKGATNTISPREFARHVVRAFPRADKSTREEQEQGVEACKVSLAERASQMCEYDPDYYKE